MTARNLGSIPGFYWDAEKNKYFPVLANHVAPEGAKYSRDNVKREREQSRKRRKVSAFQQKKATQTVQRSRILQSPLVAGISLLREQGASSSRNLEARVSALAKQTQVSDLLSLKQCTSCGKRDTVFDFAIDQATDAILWGLGSQNFGRIQYLSDSQDTYDIAAFRSSISSVTVTSSRALLATSTTSDHPSNVFIAQLSDPSLAYSPIDPTNPNYPISEASGAPLYLRLGTPETTLWTSAPNPLGSPSDLVAVAASDATYILDPQTGTLVHTYASKTDMRALDWLSPTLAIGGSPRRKTVLLFDARAGGSAARFRHPSGVVGVRAVGSSGHQTLVCGFDSMSLYDLRMPSDATTPHSRRHASASASVLSMPFSTERPSVALDVHHDAHVVAVADDENVIRLHSLTTGALLAELDTEDDKKKKKEKESQGRGAARNSREFVSRMRFVDGGSEGRPTLMVGKGAKLTEWTFGGAEDDEG